MNVLKNRLCNGTPFLKAAALQRIHALADNLEISQEEAQELTYLAERNGLEVLPTDALGRLEALETATEELTLTMADLIGGAL